jgi:DNA-binding response OmpR family regulator
MIPPAWQVENRKPRVLLIDDDADITDSVEFAMTNEGYEVRVAHDGNEGIAMAESIAPDLIVCDMMMPKRSGFMVLERLSQTLLHPVRIIMCTGNDGQRHREYASLMGVSEYITKPFVMDTLLEVSKRLLDEPLPDLHR